MWLLVQRVLGSVMLKITEMNLDIPNPVRYDQEDNERNRWVSLQSNKLRATLGVMPIFPGAVRKEIEGQGEGLKSLSGEKSLFRVLKSLETKMHIIQIYYAQSIDILNYCFMDNIPCLKTYKLTGFRVYISVHKMQVLRYQDMFSQKRRQRII